MSSVTVINRMSIKPGKVDAFIDAQHRFALALPPCGLIGGRMYRSLDGLSVVLVSAFQSKSAQEEVMQRADLKDHVRMLQPLVESSTPMVYEVAYTCGDFR